MDSYDYKSFGSYKAEYSPIVAILEWLLTQYVSLRFNVWIAEITYMDKKESI